MQIATVVEGSQPPSDQLKLKFYVKNEKRLEPPFVEINSNTPKKLAIFFFSRAHARARAKGSCDCVRGTMPIAGRLGPARPGAGDRRRGREPRRQTLTCVLTNPKR